MAKDTRRRKDGYVSEFTAFIEDFLARHPEVQEARERHRRELWDVEVDFDALARAREDSVPFPAYPYWRNPAPRRPGPLSSGTMGATQRMQPAANDERKLPSARAA